MKMIFKKNAIPPSQLRLILTFAILVHLFLPEMLYVPKKSSIYGNFNGEQFQWGTMCFKNWWMLMVFPHVCPISPEATSRGPSALRGGALR
jgi:hypothetical protein